MFFRNAQTVNVCSLLQPPARLSKAFLCIYAGVSLRFMWIFVTLKAHQSYRHVYIPIHKSGQLFGFNTLHLWTHLGEKQ